MSQVTVTSHGHTIMGHIEEYKRFWNDNVILYVNNM